MKLFKRFITVAVCATIAILPLSGCNALFGSRCNHSGANNGQYDEQSHYRICSECGGKYAVKNHSMHMTADETQHFMKCYYCDYSHSYQPHEMADWENVNRYGVRSCSTEGCNYKEDCYHVGTATYVVEDDGHYRTCENCKINITDLAAHTYKTYTDLTDSTHSLSCECGKTSEPIAHDFKYKHADGSHWQTCACGYVTEQQACTYGDYVSNTSVHYKVCSVCEGTGMMKTHFHELTEDRTRQCPECLHVEEPYAILIGTWKYSRDGSAYRLILNADWSYSVLYFKTAISSGTLEHGGDYSVRYYEGLDGKISGTISLRADTGYYYTSIEFEFKKGVTKEFRDSERRLYVKNN